eukprot:1263044-Lingulodinium_polyedra.AAC.1
MARLPPFLARARRWPPATGRSCPRRILRRGSHARRGDLNALPPVGTETGDRQLERAAWNTR